MKRWNIEDKLQCIQDHNDGVHLEDLAVKYGRSVGGIIVALNWTNEEKKQTRKVIHL